MPSQPSASLCLDDGDSFRVAAALAWVEEQIALQKGQTSRKDDMIFYIARALASSPIFLTKGEILGIIWQNWPDRIAKCGQDGKTEKLVSAKSTISNILSRSKAFVRGPRGYWGLADKPLRLEPRKTKPRRKYYPAIPPPSPSEVVEGMAEWSPKEAANDIEVKSSSQTFGAYEISEGQNVNRWTASAINSPTVYASDFAQASPDSFVSTPSTILEQPYVEQNQHVEYKHAELSSSSAFYSHQSSASTLASPTASYFDSVPAPDFIAAPPSYQDPDLGQGSSSQAAMVPAGLLRVQTRVGGIGDALHTSTSTSMWSASPNDLYWQHVYQSAGSMIPTSTDVTANNEHSLSHCLALISAAAGDDPEFNVAHQNTDLYGTVDAYSYGGGMNVFPSLSFGQTQVQSGLE